MKYFATILLLLGLSATSQAQITMTSSELINAFTKVGTITSFSANTPSQFATLLATSGANQTWDFTGKSYTQEAAGVGVSLISASQAPLSSDPDFAAANYALKTTNLAGDTSYYDFVKIDATGEWSAGIAGQLGGTTMKLFSYNPPLQELAFPLTYQTAWNGSTTATAAFLPPGATRTTTVQGVVDGYGTLILPAGGSHQALRIRKSEMSATTIFGHTTYDTTYTFSWYTKEGFGAVIVANGNQQPTSASYSIPSGGASVSQTEDPLSIRISANPAMNEETQLFYSLPNDAPVQVALMDALGHNVRLLADGHAAAGQNIVPIDPRSLAAGTYFIRITSPNMTEMRKLVIVK